jgi:hypothetical protein
MIPIKRLYLVAGFSGQDLEATVHAIEKHYVTGDRRFIRRVFPTQPYKRATYLSALVQTAIKLIFGDEGATNFCRRLDQPCALDMHKGQKKAKSCQVGKEIGSACARQRPELVILICADQIYDEVLEKLGRGTIILRLPGPELPDKNALIQAIDQFEPIAADVVNAVSNRDKSLYAPLIPDRNFQRPTAQAIMANVQANPADFRAIMQLFHKALYSPNFQNPRKKGMRGAYMYDADTAFQEDHFHKAVQQIGPESRVDGFHLLNAYHVYGVKTDPGFHFDVMNSKGKAIGHVFEDVLAEKATKAADTHINITPCDRVV